jgi:hypothetical protein
MVHGLAKAVATPSPHEVRERDGVVEPGVVGRRQ